MSKLTILKYPDERLRTVAQPVAEVDDRLRQQIDDMLETMYESNVVGLAATQVDFHYRLFVADCSEDQNAPLVFIIPDITDSEGEFINDEGCLSFAGVYALVDRVGKVIVEALGRSAHLLNFS